MHSFSNYRTRVLTRPLLWTCTYRHGRPIVPICRGDCNIAHSIEQVWRLSCQLFCIDIYVPPFPDRTSHGDGGGGAAGWCREHGDRPRGVLCDMVFVPASFESMPCHRSINRRCFGYSIILCNLIGFTMTMRLKNRDFVSNRTLAHAIHS